MRKVLFPLAFICATTGLACSFSMRAGGGSQTPNNQAQNTATAQNTGTTPTSTPSTPATPAATARVRLGKQKFPTPTPTTTSTSTASPTATGTSTAPPGVAVVSGTTPFGSGTPDPSGWKGTISWLPAGTTKLPNMGQQPAAGYLFIHELNIAVRPFNEGFPGVDANRKENFAIRYEAPLVVNNEADYEFRLAADDGAVLLIDGTVIVDNDGVHDFKDKTGPVHLVKGTHVMTVDYFQTTGNVGLQLFCKKMGEATDKICTTTL